MHSHLQAVFQYKIADHIVIYLIESQWFHDLKRISSDDDWHQNGE
tara:strand:- start:136 stop:270 length:135 start_codon:yes stop_codon:yes gene_type:complete